MLLQRIILLLLSWPCVRGAFSKNDGIDQLQIPAKNINRVLTHSANSPPHTPGFELDSVEHGVETSTIHYENSNGFVPVIIPVQQHEQPQNTNNSTNRVGRAGTIDRAKVKSGEDDPAYLTETRIFLSLPSPADTRRSFNTNNRREDFEFLKVNNATPAVANYQEFISNPQSITQDEFVITDLNRKKILKSKNRDRGKILQNLMGSYGMDQSQGKEFSYSPPNYEQKGNQAYENALNNYRQEATGHYSIQHENQARQVPVKPAVIQNNYGNGVVQKNDLKVSVPPAETLNHSKFSAPISINEPKEFKPIFHPKKSAIPYQPNVSSLSFQETSNSQNDLSKSDSKHNYFSGNNYSERTTSENYDRIADSRDFIDENGDYFEVNDRPRKLHKKRRPHPLDLARKLPKEHRGAIGESTDHDAMDHDRHRHVFSKTKQRHRQRVKSSWGDDDRSENEDEISSEERPNEYRYPDYLNNHDSTTHKAHLHSIPTWNQVAPNVEVSHSNGYEINQMEKPKLQLVPLNIVPVANFDHATALDNSQGFDVSNAIVQNFIPGSSLISTASPLVSTKSNHGISTSVPDIILGQSSFHSPVQTMLIPNKLQNNLKTQYIQSTVSPLFAVTPTVQQYQQAVQNIATALTPRQTFVESNTLAPNMQHMIVPHNSLQNMMQHSSSNNQVHINPRGLQGQNVLQVQNSQSSTPQSHGNLVTAESQQKKATSRHNGQFLASASLSVENGQRHQNNNNNNHNYDNSNNSNNNQQYVRPQVKSFTQSTQVVPAFIGLSAMNMNDQSQAGIQQVIQNPYIITNAQNPNAQYIKENNEVIENSMRQLQLAFQKNQELRTGLQNIDPMGSASNNNVNTVNTLAGIIGNVQKAQLPIVGTKNVEIFNPNLNANQYAAVTQVPAVMVSTPIPIIGATSIQTSRPILVTSTPETVSVQNYVNFLTQIGAKSNPQLNSIMYNNQVQQQPVFNPIHFVPNMDLLKSQSMLNSRYVQNEPLQQNLNLVPLVSGGNFFKHTQTAQNDLLTKPKLSTDLEKYAEEMFKESLRTIYNSHKWNNDHRAGYVNLTDNSELGKLRNELLRIKDSMADLKNNKDSLEGHHSETKLRATKPGSDFKKPDLSFSSLEQLLKNDFKLHSGIATDPLHIYNNNGKPTEGRHKPPISDYLTPPKPNSYISKSPFYDKPIKKRPGPGPPRFNHDGPPRYRPRGPHMLKPGSLEVASSNHDYSVHSYPHRHYDRRYRIPEYRSGDYYPTFTTSIPDYENFKSPMSKPHNKEFFDMNHPRTHNLLGLLMKNNKLPLGTQPSSNMFVRETDAVGPTLEDENRRLQLQMYDEALHGLQKKADGFQQPIITRRHSYTRPINLTEVRG